MNCYASRRVYGDALLDSAKAILAKVFVTSVGEISVAPEALDQKEASDLVLPDGSRAAVRFRNDSFRERFPNDITIRLSRDQSGLSEWHKLQRGYVRYMLYAFRDGQGMTAWTLIDVAALIEAMRSEGTRAGKIQPRGSEPFFAVDLSRFSEDARRYFILATEDEG